MKGFNPNKRSLKILGLLILISIGAIYLILPIFKPEPEPIFIDSFILTDLNGNQSDLIEMHQSKFLIINFWATWCAPCKEEMPHLNQLKSKSTFKDIEIIPIKLTTSLLSWELIFQYWLVRVKPMI